jgi:hypothetical protein
MECFFFGDKNYVVNSGYVTADKALICHWGKDMTLRVKVVKSKLTPFVTSTVMGQRSSATLVSLFLFQGLKCLRSYRSCLSLNLSCTFSFSFLFFSFFFFCPSEVSKTKIISALVIRKPRTEAQQRLLDGFLFNVFNSNKCAG